MDTHKLVKMANEIAAFFDADPDRAAAADAVASHLRRFWEPRMRRELVGWLDEHAGEGLTPTALAALKKHRDALMPKGPPPARGGARAS